MKQRAGIGERVSGMAQDVQNTLRRRQAKREPRVRLYWPDGEIRTLPATSEQGQALLEAAEALVLEASVGEH